MITFEKIQSHMSLFLGVATTVTTVAVYTGAISLVSIPVIAVGVGYSFRTLIEFTMDVYYLLKKTVINLANEVYGNVINIFKTVKSTVIKTIDVVKSGFVKAKEFVKSKFDKFRSCCTIAKDVSSCTIAKDVSFSECESLKTIDIDLPKVEDVSSKFDLVRYLEVQIIRRIFTKFENIRRIFSK